MKPTHLLLLLLLIAACTKKTDAVSETAPSESMLIQDAQKSESTPSDAKNISTGLFLLEKATQLDFQKAKASYQDSFLQDTLSIRKKNGAIRIKTGRSWQPYVVFADTLLGTDDDAIREYQYLGQYKELDKYLVGGSFWEHYECYAVDKATGTVTTFWTCPSISPDRKFLANLSMSYGLEGIPNGIQIWKAVHEYQNHQGPIVLSKFIEIDQQVWAPDEFIWESASSIILKTYSIETFWEKRGETNDADYNYLRLTFN